MDREEHTDRELVDLGSVTEETKGSVRGQGDTLLGFQSIGIGLEDD